MIRSDRLVVSGHGSPAAHELAADLAREIAGEVRFDAGSQAMYAHDASNYRQVLIGVVIPRSTEDVEQALRICREHGVPVVSRGGGTSLAGQTVNRAVVLDHSKYLNQVLEVDAGRWRVRVQPGCVLDEMRAALGTHGLTYGPDPATHNHCTLGGMLGNNSCGIHSVMGELVRPGRANLGSRRVAGHRDLRWPAHAGRRDVRGRARAADRRRGARRRDLRRARPAPRSLRRADPRPVRTDPAAGLGLQPRRAAARARVSRRACAGRQRGDLRHRARGDARGVPRAGRARAVRARLPRRLRGRRSRAADPRIPAGRAGGARPGAGRRHAGDRDARRQHRPSARRQGLAAGRVRRGDPGGGHGAGARDDRGDPARAERAEHQAARLRGRGAQGLAGPRGRAGGDGVRPGPPRRLARLGGLGGAARPGRPVPARAAAADAAPRPVGRAVRPLRTGLHPLPDRLPRHAYAFGWIHRWALLASYVPWLVNFATQTPGLRRIAAWLAGAAPHRPIPRFAARPFSRSFVPRRNDRMPVVLWPDTFNNHFFPQTLDAAVAVLEDAGCRVIVPRAHVCCGRALYDYGMLGLARRLWRRTFRILEPAIARGVPIVGLEPSCVAAFRDELPSLFPGDDRARRLSELTHTLAGFLRGRGYQPPPLPVHALLHGHCHHKAVLDFGDERELLTAMGVELETPDSGCCGLAGSFGFEPEHYEISMAIGERALLPAVRAGRADGLVIADGFSCREQIRHGTGRTALHVAEVAALALRTLRGRVIAEPGTSPRPARVQAGVTSAP